jgi:hypothetical protein
MASSSDDRGDARWAVVLCSLVALVVFAGVISVAGLFVRALDAVMSSMLADAFAQVVLPYEIMLFALWLALRPLSPLFPLFGIPKEFPVRKPGGAA